MLHISLSDKPQRTVPFYLAMEEFVACNIVADECLFTWRVEPSVILGRNQLIDTEVDTHYCHANTIKIYRRKSGGGCVYADLSNLMISYVTKQDNVALTYNRYTSLITAALMNLGIMAEANGRNDIMVDGKKVSGNAFYHHKGRSIVHGTLLYDTNMEHMTKAITPNNIKLESKGVKSIRQHITLLKDHTKLSLPEIERHIIETLCKERIELQPNDIDAIERIAQSYTSHEFLYGNNPTFCKKKTFRIDNVGEFCIKMDIRNNIIRKVNMTGDFFVLKDDKEELLSPFQGITLSAEEIKRIVPEAPETVIANLSRETFTKMLMETALCQP